MTTFIAKRYVVPAIPGAMLITFALFIFMYMLIDNQYIEPVDPLPPVTTNVFDPPHEPTGDVIKRPPPPEKIETPPERLVTTASVETETTKNPMVIAHTPLNNKIIIGSPDAGPIPAVRVAPSYPRIAAQKGLSGYVQVIFDITAQGKTENIRVIDSQPKRIFDRAAVKAVSKWKYQPQTQDGKPMRTNNVVTKVIFEMET